MQIQTGQILIHPFHGPMTVTGMSDRVFKGNQVTYIELSVTVKDLTLQVPLQKAEQIGLRPVMSVAELDEVFVVLAEETEPSNDTWAHRTKEYQRQLQEGTNTGRAIVIREIARRHGGQPMPGTEKQMYLDALDLLAEEAALCLDEPKDAVRERLISSIGTVALVS